MKIFRFISTLVFKLRSFKLIFRQNLSISSSVVMLPTFINNKGDNRINIIDGYISKSSIVLSGEGNLLTLHGEIFNTRIKIMGTRNRILLSPDVKLYNSNIFVKAEDAVVLIGNASSIGEANIVCMGNGNSIEIGSGCMLAEGIEIWNTDGHDITDSESGELLNPSEPVVIGDKVWIGKNVTILKGVTIGSGAIIGMNSTITKDVPESTIVVGDNKIVRQGVEWSHRWTKN